VTGSSTRFDEVFARHARLPRITLPRLNRCPGRLTTLAASQGWCRVGALPARTLLASVRLDPTIGFMNAERTAAVTARTRAVLCDNP
jgi:hypothetical protein